MSLTFFLFFVYQIPTANSNSTRLLNDDLAKITDWAWRWKMLFNPDVSKQAVEVIFSNKGQKTNYPPLVFNGIPVKLMEETKHLGMILNSKLNFQSHLSEKIAKRSLVLVS